MVKTKHIQEEPRDNDGKTWTKEELKQVCKLYSDEKEKIHEYNPEIQKLAEKLQRGTRAVEAQLLMFRNLDKDGDYSRGNMNKLCKEVWEEMNTMDIEGNQDPGIGNDGDSDTTLFPQAFFLWTGARDGGVKKPFDDQSGRPTKFEIKTGLLTRLHKWTRNLVHNNTDIRVIFLVGGPGNGKTDAIESCIRTLDKELGNDGQITRQFKERFFQSSARKVTADMSHEKYSKITLVQDATVKDSQSNKSPEELFLEDLEKIVINGSDTIFLCCVNKGILAQSISKAHHLALSPKIINLLDKISNATTVQHSPVDAWPLEGYPGIAVWPMDIESLVDPLLYDAGKTPVHQVFEHAVSNQLWKDHSSCQNKNRCPFAHNHEQLSDPDTRENLISLLHYYELATGKRWSFRDLFSLVGHLMVGPEKSFEVRGKMLTPCDWVQKQLSLLEQDPQAIKPIYALNCKLYQHVLFPRWPRLGKLRYEHNMKFKRYDGNEVVRAFFNFLHSHKPDTSTDISRIIQGSFSDILEPAEALGDLEIFKGGKLTVNDIEESFSHSVKLGKSKFSRHLLDLEKLLLDKLLAIEDALESLDMNKKVNSKLIRLVHNQVKIFACRFVKRSLGVRKGFCKNIKELSYYLNSLKDKTYLMQLRREFEQLINTKNRFEMSLVTTFGQPSPSLKHDTVLKAPPVSVHPIEIKDSEKYPRSNLQYFKVKDYPVPLTFGLFTALHDSRKGLHQASLPSHIFALLDSTRAKVVGQVVRDPETMFNTEIEIGETKERIRYELDTFMVTKEEHV